MDAKRFVAQRELLYSLKGGKDRRRLVIRVGAPREVNRLAADVAFDEGASICTIEFDGLDIGSIDVHGIDPLHALSLATDVDSYLRGLTATHDFFWPTGEPYFE